MSKFNITSTVIVFKCFSYSNLQFNMARMYVKLT